MKFVDFFSGIGGFRVGLEQLGWQCVFSNDINVDSNKIYSANFIHDAYSHDSIEDVLPSDIPDFDVFCGGFPCQPFSIAGKRRGEVDPRGNLFKDIIRICQDKMPKVIFLENVKNLFSMNKGEIFSNYKKELEKIGYDVYFDVLDSSNFRVPQSRPRVYIVAFRRDLKVSNFEFPVGYEDRLTVSDIINPGDNSIPLGPRWEFYVDYYNGVKSELDCDFVIPKTRKKLERIDKDAKLDDCIFQLRSSGVRALSINKPLPTLAVSISGGGAMIPIYSKEKRHLSILELQRVMGFPDHFKFPVSRTAAIKGLANAVCPPVIEEIGRAIAIKL